MGILTISSDPRMLIEKHNRVQTNFMWLLRQYIEEKFTTHKMGTPERTNVAGLVTFRREGWHEEYSKRESLGGLGILVWAPSNYLSVFKKVGDLPLLFDFKQEWSGWEFVTSCHAPCQYDSCWINSIENILRDEEDTLGLLTQLPAVKSIELSEKAVEYLRGLKKETEELRIGGGVDMGKKNPCGHNLTTFFVRNVEERVVNGLSCLIVRFRRDNSDLVDPEVNVVGVLRHVGFAKAPKNWKVYEMGGVLYRRVGEDVVSGKKTRWFRNKRYRKHVVKHCAGNIRDDGRVSGYIHYWSGGRPWGGANKGKFCLTRLDSKVEVMLIDGGGR